MEIQPNSINAPEGFMNLTLRFGARIVMFNARGVVISLPTTSFCTNFFTPETSRISNSVVELWLSAGNPRGMEITRYFPT